MTALTGAAPPAADDFLPAVLAFVTGKGLITPDSRVLIALSGGPDSCALALVLGQAAAEGLLPPPVGTAHFHHGLRGEDADRDAAFSAALSLQLNLPCVIGLGAVEGGERSPNEAARQARYSFLKATARELEADTVATAHTADDQAETVLGRVLRGTGVDGLAGIPARRTMAPGLVVVRPLLGARRSQIEAFCTARGVTPRTDPSNTSDKYTRSRLRKRLPELAREFNPRLTEALVRLAESAALDSELLEDQAESVYQQVLLEISDSRAIVDRERLRRAHPALRRRVLRQVLWRLAGDLPIIAEIATTAWLQQLERLVLEGPALGLDDLPGGLRVLAHGSVIILNRTETPPQETRHSNN